MYKYNHTQQHKGTYIMETLSRLKQAAIKLAEQQNFYDNGLISKSQLRQAEQDYKTELMMEMGV